MRHDGRTHLSSIDQSAIKRRVTRKVDHLREDCGSGLDPERAGSDEEMPEGSVPSSMRICSISGEEEEECRVCCLLTDVCSREGGGSLARLLNKFNK